MSETARWLFVIGGIPIMLAGAGHGLATLVDTRRPTFFTPDDPAVREAMQRTGVRLRSMFPGAGMDPTLWRAWLGFNLSHSLGAVVFGLACLLLGLRDFAFVAGSGVVMPGAIAVAGAYLAISLTHWFYAPTAAISLSLVALVAAYAAS